MGGARHHKLLLCKMCSSYSKKIDDPSDVSDQRSIKQISKIVSWQHFLISVSGPYKNDFNRWLLILSVMLSWGIAPAHNTDVLIKHWISIVCLSRTGHKSLHSKKKFVGTALLQCQPGLTMEYNIKNNKNAKIRNSRFEIRTHHIRVASHASAGASDRPVTRPWMNFP